MGAVYATLADLRAHWPGLPVDREDEAEEKLVEASIEIRGTFPDVDARLASGSLDPEVPRLVACRMVKRAMKVPDELESVTTLQQTAGPFSQSRTFVNSDGNVYLSARDKALLRADRVRKAWTIHPRRY